VLCVSKCRSGLSGVARVAALLIIVRVIQYVWFSITAEIRFNAVKLLQFMGKKASSGSEACQVVVSGRVEQIVGSAHVELLGY